jgi:predicted permease
MIADLVFRARALFRRGTVEAELDRELRAHLDGLVRKHVDRGRTPGEAERLARLEFGGVEQSKEACRDARGLGLLDTGWRDLRYAGRLLRADVAFTAIAMLTLALGIGASTAAFSVVRTLLLKPLAYPDAERIVFPWMQPPHGIDVGFDDLQWGRTAFLTFAGQTRTFSHVGAFLSGQFNLTGAGEPERLDGLLVSEGFLPSLGLAPVLGRTFSRDDDQPGHARVVLLSDRLWRERFAADPAIVGRSVTLNGDAHTVIGVMPAGFAFPRDVQMPGGFSFPREAALWVPLALPAGPPVRGEPNELAVVGRLAAGVTPAQAQTELDAFSAQMESRFPNGKGWFNTHLRTLPRQATGETARAVWLLFAAVGVVLLIGCANVASLLLTKALNRGREFRLRAALGASRPQLVRQLITESLLLSGLGGLAGLLLAEASVAAVRVLGPTAIPRLSDVSVDPPVLLFALGVSLATGLLFGLAPVLGTGDHGLARSARDGRGGTKRGARLHRVLLVAEVALALVLVTASGLLVQTFVHLWHAGGGFDAERVLTFELTLPSSKYADPDRIVRVYQHVLDTVRAVPGVHAAGVSETVPMGGAGESTGIRIPGRPPSADHVPLLAAYTIASSGYFSAVGTPIIAGRAFLDSDTATSQPVAIVSAAMARRYWPGQDVVGKAVSLPIYAFDMRIVGIAADVKHQSFREDPGPEMYVPLTQKPWPSMATLHVVVRTITDDPQSMTASVRAAVRAVDPDLPIAHVTTLEAIAADTMVRPRFAMLVLSAFGLLALVLACVGLYGVVSGSVAQRTQEIGVRMALGAPRRRVFVMVLGDGARVAGLGIAIGGVASLAVLQTGKSFLYGVEPTDPATFVVVSALLFAVALLACYIPARRATRIDPMTALRCE